MPASRAGNRNLPIDRTLRVNRRCPEGKPVKPRAGDPLAMYLNDLCTIPVNIAGNPAVTLASAAESSGGAGMA